MAPTASARAPWFADETPIALHEIAGALPPRADGTRISRSTPARWVRVGLRGIRLRAFPLGARGLATTREELNRFLAALASLRGLDS